MWRLGEGPRVQGQIWGSFGKSLEILILEGVRGLGPEIGNIDTGGGGGPCGGGLWTDTGNRVC